MKKMMSRFRSTLKENLLLLLLLIGFGMGIFLALWKCSLEGFLSKAETDYGTEWKFLFEAETELLGDHVLDRN
ncbi:MAG TPA: hypothetical protein IAC80_00770 [Candidatus Merdiplasma excrementigallinarum]|uniref:Uncharacterized protein n=1 Tax=Candidatus Merdiplasma excrementigallinarum TaxID=2840864 RepID=A0A9D1NXK7_9FIRM|nr:hypothetical protein [Candidatus Merdiplasma excrementigallinarum]